MPAVHAHHRITGMILLLMFIGASWFSPAWSLAQERGIADFPGLSAENDWPWWRGPQRNGYVNGPAPTNFGPTENVIWKAAVPGRGHSSPTVVGSLVVLATADEKNQVHSVLAYDRATGKPLWKTDVSQGGFPARNHAKNTEATATVACDGERLFATFYHHEQVELFALSAAGKVLWKVKAGPFNPRRYEYGYAPSPLVYRSSVIVAAEYEGDNFIAAFERATGKELWRIKRPFNISFSSPVVAHLAGKDQLLLSGGQQICSYDPASGAELWKAAGCATATCGTVVWDGDVVFASGGYPQSETVAIKADGSGELLWKNNQKCYEQSMLATGGYLYGLTDQGVAYCWRASDGQEMWKQRLRGPVSASPVLAGGNIYWANELGSLYVFRANPEKFDPIVENRIGEDSFPSPAICGGRVYLRVAERAGGGRQEVLYCFGSK